MELKQLSAEDARKLQVGDVYCFMIAIPKEGQFVATVKVTKIVNSITTPLVVEIMEVIAGDHYVPGMEIMVAPNELYVSG